MSTPWLEDFMLSAALPHIALCVTEQEFDQALKDAGRPGMWTWAEASTPPAKASTFTVQDPATGRSSCIVAVYNHSDIAPRDLAAILVHEATHIWQRYREVIGEDRPGREQEAYAMQFISGALFDAYAERIGNAENQQGQA
jgi:hypothetical protein